MNGDSLSEGQMAWNTEYWDVMRQLYWEPKELGCKRIIELCADCQKKKPSKELRSELLVIDQLKRREVSLNNVMNIFFSILPSRITSRIFGTVFEHTIADEFTLLDRGAFGDRYGLNFNAAQQDLLFVGNKSFLCVEMKLGTKSKLLQVAKYALQCALEEQLSGKKAAINFVLLAPEKPFSLLWEEAFEDTNSLVEAAHYFDPATIKKKQLRALFESQYEVVERILKQMHFTTMGYQKLGEMLSVESNKLDRTHESDEALFRLINGMITELSDRHLYSTT